MVVGSDLTITRHDPRPNDFAAPNVQSDANQSSQRTELIKAVKAVESGRLHLAAGHIRERSAAITKASLIIEELTASLNLERGGTLAADLRELYDYIQRRLTQANIEQADQPLAEVQSLIATLLEAWNQINPPELHSPRDIVDS